MAAAFRSIGIDARPSPEGDTATYELARCHLSGDECLPEVITLGNFLKVTQQPDYDPGRTAFFLPTSDGPCRFGQYLHLARKIFRQRKEDEVLFFSPSSTSGYEDIGWEASDLLRTAWRAVIVSDILRKLLLKTRPYEQRQGDTDALFARSMDRLCEAIASPDLSHRLRLEKIVRALENARDQFRAIPRHLEVNKPLIGVVGEIFCRLNDFSNDFILRMIEKLGGEAWMSDVAEWVWYTNDEEIVRLKRTGRWLSVQMLKARIKNHILHRDEIRLLAPFAEDFRGYEEPDVNEILRRSEPYLPRDRAHGEMVISVGKAIWYYEKGAQGVIDVSPFTCMNGIVCESVYPRVSRDLGDFPIRIFYFDGLQSNLERDLEIFMELARNYSRS